MARLILLAIGTMTVACGVAASAASLPVSSGSLAAGTDDVGSCDGLGVDFRYAVDAAGRITSVTVTNIDSTCQGRTLRVALTASGAEVGSGSVQLPTSGWTGTYALPISPTPLSSTVTATYAAIDGP